VLNSKSGFHLLFILPKSSFGEHRLTHAGLGKPINEYNMRLSVHDASLSPFPTR
jgi:hypothetical protein